LGHYREHPDEGDRFVGAMTGRSASVAGPVTAAFDTAPYKRIVDVGGGHGHLLRALLAGAGYELEKVIGLPGGQNVLVAR
jgi:hypothetical protein